MKLVLLGTAGYHPTERRQTACVFLPEVGVVLDAGTGMFRLRGRIETRALDIFLSHAHLDHIVGLTYLLDVLPKQQLDRVTVHALPAKLAAIDEHLLNEQLFPVKLPCEMQPLVAPVPLADSGVLRHFPLVHPGGSIGFRLDWPGHSLAYVTDTATPGAGAPYIEQIRNVDLLIHECYYSDGNEEMAKRTGHCCATQVAEVARAADVQRLLLIHTSPADDNDDPIGLSTIRAIFPNAELGRDGMEAEF